jgi:hypothetical protein
VERTPIAELKLTGSPNLKRALRREPKRPRQLAKRAELEALFAELQQRRRDCLADVRENGMTVQQEHSNARGMIYHRSVVNPALKIAQDCERQLVHIARVLNADDGVPGEPQRKSSAQLLADVDQFIKDGKPS